MDYEILGNSISIHIKVDFMAPVRQVLEIAEGLVVRLSPEESQNVYLISDQGRIVWQIEHYFGGGGTGFTNIWLKEDKLFAYSGYGFHYHVEKKTGRLTDVTVGRPW